MHKAHEVFEAQRHYERRSGYNRGIRAAAKMVMSYWVAGKVTGATGGGNVQGYTQAPKAIRR